MGYADLSQIGTGLRQRLYARSFIIGDPNNPADRFVYMVLDTQSGDTAIRYGILDGVAALGSDYASYGQSNVAVVGTHSHSGPAAWLNYLLPQITSKGFDKQSFQAIVDGGVLSIKRAHESLAAGTLSYGEVNVANATIAINRSPYAYLANPAEERDQYDSNVENTMSMLRFTRASDSKDMGILTWLPVHGTSMLGNNTLASGDNKGYAMTMFEKSVRGLGNVADGFVAGFSQANVGDTTPRVLGAWCEDGTNVQCTFEQSLCSGKNEGCYGRGPNFTVKDNGATDCATIGTRQYEAARSLWDNWTGTPITGPVVRSFHTFQNMTFFDFTLPNGTAAQTCAAALGHSFAAGTSDWPGTFDFKQGESGHPDNPLWNAVGGFVAVPSEAQVKCQYPKPILLDVGDAHSPYDWSPDIVDMQVMRVGQMFMIASPGEATTMSGRRWKNAIAAAANSSGMTDGVEPIVVLGGPANSYTHYIATEEEYGIQRYEGASTLYGPHTLNAYINMTVDYLPYLSATPPSTPLPSGPLPPNNVNNSLSFITGVVYDNADIGKSFGSVLTDVPAKAAPGDTVNATFVGANPRNDLRLESTYAAVQQQTNGTGWTTVRDDSDWDLIFNWVRTNSITGTSSVTIQWILGSDVPAGTYRMQYFGASKAPFTGTITQFNGTSGTFTVS